MTVHGLWFGDSVDFSTDNIIVVNKQCIILIIVYNITIKICKSVILYL